jgi:hypothetical protein
MANSGHSWQELEGENKSVRSHQKIKTFSTYLPHDCDTLACLFRKKELDLETQLPLRTKQQGCG